MKECHYAESVRRCKTGSESFSAGATERGGSGTKADLAEFLVHDKGAGCLVCNRYVG